MRIAINAAYLRAGSHDGIARFARGVIDNFPQLGDDVLVYTSAVTEFDNHDRVQYRRTPAALAVRNGPLASFLRLVLWSQTILPFRTFRDRPDVLLSLGPEGSIAPVVPQVLVVHDLFPFIFPEIFGRLRPYFVYGLPRVLASCDRLIAVSQYTKNDLVERLGVPEEKIFVVYEGVDSLFLSDDPGVAPKGCEPEPYFLFVGRCMLHKNIETVMRAFAAVHHKLPHRLYAVLDLYGAADEAHFAKLKLLASDLGITDKLRIYSRLSGRELLFLYRHATALLLLSKYEGFGLPPLEAMAVGTPAIVSEATALAEVAGPGAICIPGSDHERAAYEMAELATNSAYRARRSDAAVAHARQFTWENTVRQIRSVLQHYAK